MTDQTSGLLYIDVQDINPFELFKNWQQEIIDTGGSFFQTHVMCLATSTPNGRVSNRSIILKEFNDDGFNFVTSKEGRKAKEIEENPCVAATFLWNYVKDGVTIFKQIRIEGKAHKISTEKCQKYYDEELFFCKIRTHVCHQSQEVDWKILKKQHDQLVDDVLNKKKELAMPDYYIGYQIVPEQFDFHYNCNTCIGDRVVFSKTDNNWKFVHLAA